MTDSLAIISGKGGCGKTTITISLAQLFAKYNIRTLLVDCDLSTYGLTYFFEGLLTEKDRYYTVKDFFSNKESMLFNKEILEVSKNIDFIPSCVNFPSELINNRLISEDNFNQLLSFINNNYDIVIYDCQAGYSIMTDLITRHSRKTLIVTESDSISASAMRVLYSQLSEQLDHGITYQIFNKITKEEQDVYSKLLYGTLFTNIPPILFDWNIRKAFIINELPDINLSNPVLMKNVYNLAKTLFPQHRKKIESFNEDIKSKINTDLENIKQKVRYKKMMRLFPILLIVFVNIISVFLYMNFHRVDNFTIISLLLILLYSLIGMASQTKIMFNDVELQKLNEKKIN